MNLQTQDLDGDKFNMAKMTWNYIQDSSVLILAMSRLTVTCQSSDNR